MKFFMHVCISIVSFQKITELSFGVLICAKFPENFGLLEISSVELLTTWILTRLTQYGLLLHLRAWVHASVCEGNHILWFWHDCFSLQDSVNLLEAALVTIYLLGVFFVFLDICRLEDTVFANGFQPEMMK